MNSFSVVSAAERLRERDRLRRMLRFAGPAGYAVVLTVFVYREGMPLSRDRLLMWILLGLLASSLTNIARVDAWRRPRVASVRVRALGI